MYIAPAQLKGELLPLRDFDEILAHLAERVGSSDPGKRTALLDFTLKLAHTRDRRDIAIAAAMVSADTNALPNSEAWSELALGYNDESVTVDHKESLLKKLLAKDTAGCAQEISFYLHELALDNPTEATRIAKQIARGNLQSGKRVYERLIFNLFLEDHPELGYDQWVTATSAHYIGPEETANIARELIAFGKTAGLSMMLQGEERAELAKENFLATVEPLIEGGYFYTAYKIFEAGLEDYRLHEAAETLAAAFSLKTAAGDRFTALAVLACDQHQWPIINEHLSDLDHGGELAVDLTEGRLELQEVRDAYIQAVDQHKPLPTIDARTELVKRLASHGPLIPHEVIALSDTGRSLILNSLM
jgi:hypothetical protein